MKTPLKQKAYEYVLEKIISGSFEPGARLSEVAMAREIGVSPTPLREAYRQLASEGLLKYVPNSGVFVRDLSEDETAELYEAREALEPFCASLAARKMNLIMVEELWDCLEAMFSVARELRDSGAEEYDSEQESRYLRADAQFHILILKAAGNRIIMKTMRECHVLGRLLSLKKHKHTLRQVAVALRQHYKIYSAIKRHDSSGAADWMRSHIQFSRDTIRRAGAPPEPSLSEKIHEFITGKNV